MTDKHVVLITGGNTGIGYETVKALYASGIPYVILMGTRSLDKGKDAISKLQSEVSVSTSDVVPIQIDIESDDSIANAVKEVESKYGRLDSLINNAGGAFDRLAQETPGPKGLRAAWDHAYHVNVSSTQANTYAFMPLLLKSTSTPRLAFITSGLSSLTTCSEGRISAAASQSPPAGWPKPPDMTQTSYRSSKVALNMMMLEWHRILKEDGVKVFCISPGFLATGLAGIGAEKLKSFGAGDPSIGGNIIREVIEGKRDANAGKVVNKDGVQPW